MNGATLLPIFLVARLIFANRLGSNAPMSKSATVRTFKLPAALDRPPVIEALGMMHKAQVAASAVNTSPWQFALEQSYLKELGVDRVDLRWMLLNRIFAHGIERGTKGSVRAVTPVKHLIIQPRSCFILTPSAESMIEHIIVCHNRPGITMGPMPNDVRPGWSGRQLTWNGFVVAEYKRAAPNQELLLMSFEEGGWPLRIDDPLPPRGAVDPPTRLHDTVRGINDHMVRPLIRFYCDGTGRGVVWRIMKN